MSFDTNANASDLIKEYLLTNTNSVILAHLNINSFRNKCSCFKELVTDNIDVLVIQETKHDESFPENSFMIPGYKNLIEKTKTLTGEGYYKRRHTIP